MIGTDPATGGEVAAWCGVIVAVLGLLAAVFTPILAAIFRRLGGIEDKLVKSQLWQAVRDEQFRDLPCQRGEVDCPPDKEVIGRA